MNSKLVSFLALSLALLGCGTASMDLGDDDASVGSDANVVVSLDSGNNGTDASSGADVAAPPDNGSSADVEHPQPSGCTDADKDGVCSTAQKADCNDNDPTVSPSLPEVCGDGKDNNCSGAIDEGCPAPQPVSSLTITYPTKYERVLNVQVTTNKADLGGFWNHTSATVVDYSVTEQLPDIDLQANCQYVLWNVVDKNPSTPYNTACVGNGATADMDKNAVPTLKLSGSETFSKDKMITWSHPAGTSKGCAGLFVKSKNGNVASCGF